MPKCVICGDEFKPNKNHRHATCSKIECKRENKRRVRARREGKPLGDISERPCAICGAAFRPKVPRQRTCSGPECKQLWRNKMATERYNANREK